jgi:hypothetical protein
LSHQHKNDLQTPFKTTLKKKNPHPSLISVLLITAVFALIPGAVFASCSTPLNTISINASREIIENPLTRLAIEDVQQLFKKGFLNASVRLNDPAADVQIVLPEINPNFQHRIPRFALHRPYHYLPYPDHAYEWRSYRKDGKTVIKLDTPSYQGVSFGLYGLLQEKLGFKFYHPKRTIIPSHTSWPLSPVFRWQATPRFDKKGFHIHTLHPIELTEQIHNPDYPNAIADLKEYIDWLARNQQNVFQFYLLRGIDRDRWIEHAGDFVDYAHKRGILTGVEISLSSVQQQAFTAIKLLKLSSSYRRQIDDTLSWLFRVKWDFVSVDFSMGEYWPDLGSLFPSLKEYMVKEITERYDAKFLYTTHVIPDQGKDTAKNAEAPQPLRSLKPHEADMPKTGILIHTVMCYSITEPYAPVYGNRNQRGMLNRAIRENQRQETWYWPESAYWVSFDNSVPLFLLMYLDSRLSDMETMKKTGVDNHLTFSSGWEWGYWLVDWSIARWSWMHIEGGKEAVPDPLAMLWDLFPDQRIHRLWHEALGLQNHYLKEAGLMPFLSALDPSAELPWPFNKPFQPRPPFSYRWLLKNAPDAEAEKVLQGPVAMLEEYARKMNTVVAGLRRASKRNFHGLHNGLSERGVILEELTRGLEMTALRASHRALTIRALIEKKKERAGKGDLSEQFLADAASVRAYAQSVVRQQETIYRYPVGLIARKREDHTSYRFGYLYPASNLFFWFREEQQVRNTRFDGLYMSIWDFRRLASVESLLW